MPPALYTKLIHVWTGFVQVKMQSEEGVSHGSSQSQGQELQSVYIFFSIIKYDYLNTNLFW